MHYSHRLSETRLHQIVGGFVILPALIIGAILFVVAKSENLFEEKYRITTVFSEGYGLKPGQPVILLGFQIGQVGKVAATYEVSWAGCSRHRSPRCRCCRCRAFPRDRP